MAPEEEEEDFMAMCIQGIYRGVGGRMVVLITWDVDCQMEAGADRKRLYFNMGDHC